MQGFPLFLQLNMNSERNDICTEKFLWTASKLIQDISKENTSRKTDLNSLATAFRCRTFKFLEGNKQKVHLCPKCYTPWREGKFSLRIRRKQVPKSSSKRNNLQIVRCHVCENRSKSVVSKPERKNLEVESSCSVLCQSDDAGKVFSKKKKRKQDKLAGLNIPSATLNSSNKPCFKRNSKQSNFVGLTGKPAFTEDHKTVLSGQNVAKQPTDTQSSCSTSNNLSTKILLSRHSIKNTINSLTNSINSKKNKKKEKLKKNKRKVNELKNFINSL